MLQPREDFSYLSRRFEGALIVVLFPLLCLVEYFRGLGKVGRTIAIILTGLFFWIGLGYTIHNIISFLVSTYIHL